jgi:hypothetical protein
MIARYTISLLVLVKLLLLLPNFVSGVTKGSDVSSGIFILFCVPFLLFFLLTIPRKTPLWKVLILGAP